MCVWELYTIGVVVESVCLWRLFTIGVVVESVCVCKVLHYRCCGRKCVCAVDDVWQHIRGKEVQSQLPMCQKHWKINW